MMPTSCKVLPRHLVTKPPKDSTHEIRSVPALDISAQEGSMSLKIAKNLSMLVHQTFAYFAPVHYLMES